MATQLARSLVVEQHGGQHGEHVERQRVHAVAAAVCVGCGGGGGGWCRIEQVEAAAVRDELDE